MYDLGDRLLMVASDRISTYDVTHPTPIPDKGKVLTALSVFWFEQTGEIVPNHLVSATEERARRGPRARAVGHEARHAARRVRRARLPDGLGLEGLPGDRRRRGHRAARGAERVPAAARADLHPLDEGRGRPRRDDRLRPRGGARRRPRADGEAARPVDRAVLLRRRAVLRRRRHPRRHEVRVRPRRRRHDPRRRRGADARLVALLARRHVRGRARRSRASTSSTSATGRTGTGWDKKPPAPAIPDDVVAGTRERYVEAYEKITGQPFDAWLQRVAPAS